MDMFFFNKKKKHSTTVEELHREVMALQKLILETQKNNKEYHFHFGQVDIHDPNLEQLIFRLDHLDIEDLSGALNLGNNFGVNVKSSDQTRPQIAKTKEGLKFTFKDKED